MVKRLISINGNRRALKRTPTSGEAILTVDSNVFGTVSLLNLSFDSVAIKVSEPMPRKLEKGNVYSFGLTVNHQTIMNGEWKVKSLRETASECIIALDRDESQILDWYTAFVDSEVFLYSSHYRIRIPSQTEDLRAIETLFTELKDCPISIPARLKQSSTDIDLPVTLDFSSNARELRTLSFHLDEKSPDFAPEDLCIEFRFLTTLYFMRVSHVSTDPDFSLIITSIPKSILSVVNRKYDRFGSDKRVRLKNSLGQWEGTLKDVSAKGGRIELNLSDAPLELLSAEPFGLTLIEDEKNTEVMAIASVKDGRVLSCVFTDSIQATHNFFISALEAKHLPRKADNYDTFLALYRDVQYKPSDPDHAKSWKQETLTAWAAVDARLPANCMGRLDNDGSRLVAAMGTLPISSCAVYGHSGCMLKTLEGAIAFFEQMTFSMAWTTFFDSCEFFLGSYNYKSRFTIRLQTVFDLTAKPSGQYLIYTQKAFLDFKENPKSELQIKKPEETEILMFHQNVQHFIKILLCSHSKLEGLHNLEHFVVKDQRGYCLAWVIRSTALPFMTARDIFNYSWVMVNGDQKMSREVLKLLSNDLRFRARKAYVVLEDGALPLDPEKIDSEEGAFWSIVPIEDFPPVNASMALAVYKLLRKYGDAANEKIIRLL